MYSITHRQEWMIGIYIVFFFVTSSDTHLERELTVIPRQTSLWNSEKWEWTLVFILYIIVRSFFGPQVCSPNTGQHRRIFYCFAHFACCDCITKIIVMSNNETKSESNYINRSVRISQTLCVEDKKVIAPIAKRFVIRFNSFSRTRQKRITKSKVMTSAARRANKNKPPRI